MCINLANLSYSQSDLTPIEKHILLIFCIRANQYHEAWSSIERLSIDSSYSIKTIERNLKKLRDKGYLLYTGKTAPKSKRIPIYRIKLNHGLSGGDKILITDSQDFKHPLSGNLNTPQEGIQKDNIYKDNKKDIDFSISNSQPQKEKRKSDFSKSSGPKAFKDIMDLLR